MRRENERYTPAGLTAWIRKLIADNNIHGFYICKPWVNLRAEVLKEQHNECQQCRKAGRYQAAKTVHHVKTVRRYPWLALTKSNLVALCDECHYKIHHPQDTNWKDERW